MTNKEPPGGMGRAMAGAPIGAKRLLFNHSEESSSCQIPVAARNDQEGSLAAGGHNDLAPHHLAMLRDESRISDDVIAARGYRTVTEKNELNALGFSSPQQRVPGLLLPLHTTNGDNSLNVYRPDNPRVVEHKRKAKLPDGTYPCTVIKYEVAKGTGLRLDCPPVCRPMLANPSLPLWITEGQKKADSLASQGLCAIDLLGVWNFKGRNEFGGTTILADFDYIAFDGRDVRIVYDSDVMTKPEVRKALERLIEHLQRKKAHVTAVYLPGGPRGKVGVDDWLAQGHTVDELERLVEAPRPLPQPAAPIVELLDAPPPAMRRPLALVDGRAYAAAWLYVKVTMHEGTDKSGNLVKYDPPRVRNTNGLYIIRDDGAIFGDGGDQPMGQLGLEVLLSEMPPASRTWSAMGVKSYRAGERADPVDVFSRIVDVVNRFVDFHRSLADQQTMAEVVACYILASWFLPAYTVVGYLWPTGDRGSGKTVLLHDLRGRGYCLGLVTGSARGAVDESLAPTGVADLFDAIVTGDEVCRRKPDPDLYQVAAGQLSLRPAECLAVENAPLGIQSAKGAGMQCVALETTLPARMLSAADRVFPNAQSLRSWLLFR